MRKASGLTGAIGLPLSPLTSWCRGMSRETRKPNDDPHPFMTASAARNWTAHRRTTLRVSIRRKREPF